MNTTISLGLPLPLDVLGTLLNLIGSAYPNSTTKMGHRSIEIFVDNADRVEDPADLDKAKQFASEFSLDARFEGMSDDGIKLALPEYLATTFATMFIRLFADNPIAVNYLEMLVLSTDETYAVHIAKSKGQTPHELAQVYKAELQVATDRLAKIARLVEILEENAVWVRTGVQPITVEQIVNDLRDLLTA